MMEILYFLWICFWYAITRPWYWAKRLFICSWKGHKYYWAGGGFLMSSNGKPLKCRHCHHAKEAQIPAA